MTVKVAVFGREEIINRVQALIEMKGNIEMIPFPYHEAIETRELIERAVMCDVYLFTEALSYLFVKDKIEVKRLPTINVELDEYAILTSFYHLVYDKKEAIDRISIDLLEVCHVEEVLQELKLTNRNVYTYSYGHLPLDQIDSIIFHHKNLWDNDKIDYVLTSSHEVSLRLTNMDIPNYYMQIPQANLEHALKRAKSMIALNKSISSQIVAGYVRLKDQHPTSKKGRDEQDKIYKNLHVILKRFAQKTYASLLTDDKNNYIIFGTRGVLDHITNHFRTFPLLEEIEETLDIPVEIGFGLGLTAKQAEKHAQLALETCSKDPVSCCYIVNDRQETIGPIGVKQRLIHQNCIGH
ncbi:hypothetical protein [Paracerasibacillus soli]|uniref:Transcriptional regulator n=1 Tax=Paracerasibacillus soli TaxID=480284 RepID=A0ABU5CTC1_9BACI|nr:hypothetical protein [Virgibacillus soli]MDY0409576.1 hypothetical protein [Virgibacillus soli]